MHNPVMIRQRKYGGAEGWNRQADLVDGSDAWLVTLSDPARHLLLVGRRAETFPHFVVAFHNVLLPIAWEIVFDSLGRFIRATCDAILPASLNGRFVDFVDLDLHLILEPSGSYFVQDQEEFVKNAVACPASAVRMAWDGVRLARAVAESRAYPLDSSAERILGMALASAGPL